MNRARRATAFGSVIVPRLEASPPPRTLSHNLVEQVTEVRLANEAAFRRDLAQGIIRQYQETLSTLDTPAYEVLVRRAAKVVLEDALDPVRTASGDPGEIGDSDAGMQVGGNMPLDAAQLPRHHVGALRHDQRVPGGRCLGRSFGS
jgi:hypothetical protein